MGNIHERIGVAREAKHLSQSELAQAMGVTAQAVSQWEKQVGGTIPRPSKLKQLAEVLGVSQQWLLGDDEENSLMVQNCLIDIGFEIGYVNIYLYDVFEKKGKIYWCEKSIHAPIKEHQSRLIAKGIDVDKVSFIKALEVRGSSMAPILNDGDVVWIDSEDTEVVDGEVYALYYQQQLYIKTLMRTKHGIELLSQNSQCKPMMIGWDEPVHILGRKVWRSG